jgi:hypothetical protein
MGESGVSFVFLENRNCAMLVVAALKGQENRKAELKRGLSL